MKDVFCQIIDSEIPANVVYENDNVLAIMDANPYSPGHILIIPKRHYTTILDMDTETIGKIHDVAKMLIKKMENTYPNIDGIKIAVNYGEPQKVKHYHMHLLPTYSLGKTPEISQKEFCEMLKK